MLSARPRLGWGIPEVLTEDSLSTSARDQHRNVLFVGSAAILTVWLDLVPREISAIGVRLGADDRRSVLIALLVALAYFFAAFLLYGAVDLIAWTRGQIEGRDLIRGTAADRERHLGEYEAILEQHERRGEMADRVAQALLDLNTTTLRNRTVRLVVPLVLLRGGIDFLVPTVVAVTGIIWLSIEIW